MIEEYWKWDLLNLYGGSWHVLTQSLICPEHGDFDLFGLPKGGRDFDFKFLKVSKCTPRDLFPPLRHPPPPPHTHPGLEQNNDRCIWLWCDMFITGSPAISPCMVDANTAQKNVGRALSPPKCGANYRIQDYGFTLLETKKSGLSTQYTRQYFYSQLRKEPLRHMRKYQIPV